MGSSSLNRQSNHGIMDEIEGDDHVGLDSISSSSEVSGVSSSESDLVDEATSSSPPLSSSDSTSSGQLATDPLLDMSSLMQQLPFKRGLSMYFQGKAQSFTSLSNVRCLEDLAKPEKPYNKKLKSCKSYGVLSGSHRSSSHLPRTSSSSRFISKKASNRDSCSSLSANRTTGFLANRPFIPPPPHGSTRTSSISNQTPLFA